MKRFLSLFIPFALAAASTFAAEMPKEDLALFNETVQTVADDSYSAFKAKRHEAANDALAEKILKGFFDRQVKLVGAKLKPKWAIVAGSLIIRNGPADQNTYTLKIQGADGVHSVDFATDQNGKWITFTIHSAE